MRLAFSTLESELKRLTAERKAFHHGDSDQDPLPGGSPANDRSDLLNNLVKAAMMDEDDLEHGKKGSSGAELIHKGLSDEEIVGNTYIYFL